MRVASGIIYRLATASSQLFSIVNGTAVSGRTQARFNLATIRHRTVRSKGCLSNKTALAMIFKLAEAAEKSWRRLDVHNQFPKIILGVKFADGINFWKD
jgi:nicotinamide mononucleotide (NMN) deamidase PncC